jgi:hypothetical protein
MPLGALRFEGAFNLGGPLGAPVSPGREAGRVAGEMGAGAFFPEGGRGGRKEALGLDFSGVSILYWRAS